MAVSAALGVTAALGVAACGEDREGEVRIEGGSTGTSTTGTSNTETTGTETAPAEGQRTETSP